jgi:autotransporter-associated beta strand protein
VSALTITNGVLTTRETVLAEQVGSTGQLTIGNAGTWNAVGDVYAGGNFVAAGGTGRDRAQHGFVDDDHGQREALRRRELEPRGRSFSAATVDLAGGTLAAIVATNLATPINATTGGTLRADAPSTFSGALSTANNATLTKTGVGALTLSGPQSHGANTTLTVSAGTLNLNSSATGGTLAVNANAATNLGASQDLRALSVASGVTATVTAGGTKTSKPPR